jgi:hypothetical protein
MRFRCTAKVERYSAAATDREQYRVRVGCLPLHQVSDGDPFRTLDVHVSWKARCSDWERLHPAERHQRIESYVRSWVKKRGVEWVANWRPEAIETVELDAVPVVPSHDDPGDPFEITIA